MNQSTSKMSAKSLQKKRRKKDIYTAIKCKCITRYIDFNTMSIDLNFTYHLSKMNDDPAQERPTLHSKSGRQQRHLLSECWQD